MSEQGLFRKKAMQAQANKLDGDVLIALPVSSLVLTLCLVAAVVITIIFLSTSSFNRKETVSGFLQPDAGISRVTVPRMSPVMELCALRAILIPTRAYSFVESGQTTRIRFDAFPYRRFGLFEGEVSRTSRSIVLQMKSICR